MHSTYIFLESATMKSAKCLFGHPDMTGRLAKSLT